MEVYLIFLRKTYKHWQKLFDANDSNFNNHKSTIYFSQILRYTEIVLLQFLFLPLS